MSRRVNGEGSKPFQRNGRKGWYAFVRVTDARTGESTRRLVSAPNKTKLADKIKATRDAAAQGVSTRAGRALTVAEYAERWSTDHLPARNVTPSTRRLYRHALSSYVVPVLGGMKLDKVRASDVERLNAVLSERELSSSTRRLAYNVARMLFATAVRDRHMSANPAELVDRPSDTPTTQAHYRPAELARLVKACADERTLAELVPLLAWSGVRVGEALALRWSEVDLDGGTITVAATLAVDDGGRVYRQPFAKAKRVRVIPLVGAAPAALRAARARVAADKLAAGAAYLDGGLVFADELGGLLDDRDLRKTYRPLVAGAGLAGSFHALRRSTGTQLTAAGVPLGVVASILGHSSTAITQAHYTIVDTTMMREALATLESRYQPEP